VGRLPGRESHACSDNGQASFSGPATARVKTIIASDWLVQQAVDGPNSDDLVPAVLSFRREQHSTQTKLSLRAPRSLAQLNLARDTHRIAKCRIMARQQQRPVEGAQRLFNHLDRLKVEMVGRLVEDQ